MGSTQDKIIVLDNETSKKIDEIMGGIIYIEVNGMTFYLNRNGLENSSLGGAHDAI